MIRDNGSSKHPLKNLAKPGTNTHDPVLEVKAHGTERTMFTEASSTKRSSDNNTPKTTHFAKIGGYFNN